MRGVHIWCNLRKLRKKALLQFTQAQFGGIQFFIILKKYKKSYKLAFFSWCKILHYCKIWNGLSTLWKVLGNFFRKITRISKEIEQSSPCRAREPKIFGFFLWVFAFYSSSSSLSITMEDDKLLVAVLLNLLLWFFGRKKDRIFFDAVTGLGTVLFLFFNFVMWPHWQPSSLRIPPRLAIG
jgi:hypothetical protein